ncbi:MAG: PfkB family carbohydrate kinase [Spirosomataceae bacterium]
MSLLTVGSVAFDVLETPFGKTGKILGGAATYITLAASYFTQKNNLVAIVGDDFPQSMRSVLENRGINTEGVEVRKGEKTFYWSGKYHDNMNVRDTVEVQLNVMGDFDPQIPKSFQGAKYLMLGNTSPTIQKSVLDRLHKRPKLVMLDTMNLWIENTYDDLRTVLREVDILTINDEEARMLSKEYSLRKAAKIILEMGPKMLIIKKGEHGALLFHGKNVFFAPALPLEEVFDPTGAGDTFAGGFIGYLAESDDLSFENLKRALIYGSAMASFCVEKFGVERIVNLTREEIEERVSEFVKLSVFQLV